MLIWPRPPGVGGFAAFYMAGAAGPQDRLAEVGQMQAAEPSDEALEPDYLHLDTPSENDEL